MASPWDQLYDALKYSEELSGLQLATLLRPWPYTSHKFHEFRPGQRTHPTYVHALQHWFFCKERYCKYHDKA